MRRVRVSTWIVTAVFVVALVAYVIVKPAPASTARSYRPPGQHAATRTPAPRATLPGKVPSPSPRTSPSPSSSPGPSSSSSPSSISSPAPSSSLPASPSNSPAPAPSGG